MRLPDLSRWTRRRGRSGLTRDEALAACPVRNQAIAWERQENGRVLLSIPLQFSPWMKVLKALSQLPEQRQIELDELGSDVWEWCDGATPVSELAGRLSARHKLNAREAELSLTQYLQTLARRRLLGFALALDDERAAAVGASRPDREAEADERRETDPSGG